ncbi:hypothetical protein SAMN05216358_5353 [Rhizobium sp. AN5]|uniref:hypothetical protein n=1 Tax=Rhizobium sp. AN5 TaxID=1855304 RepID=UPI000BDCE4B9|nr:hypothetical protein [Rhizobium sp. AN5]SOD00249.1 hypothetical protein SAMN05216358_5353 [Rhizobium sp. AN5]
MTAATKTQRDLYETAVIERLKESGFLEIEIRTESLMRCGDGYQDEIINAGWHYWNAALSAAEPQPVPSVAVKALDTCAVDLLLYNLLGEAIQEGMHKATNPDWVTKDFTQTVTYIALRSTISAQVQDVAGTVEAFDKDHPELYWHIAKGKITAGEPLYGAIITDSKGNEIGHGESDASAVDAFNVAVAKAKHPSAPEKQDIASLETQLKHLITTRPNKAALAAFDDDTRMWFVAQLAGTASSRVPLTDIEALVARHLPPVTNDAHTN